MKIYKKDILLIVVAIVVFFALGLFSLFKMEILEYKNEKLIFNQYNIPIYGWAKKLEKVTKDSAYINESEQQENYTQLLYKSIGVDRYYEKLVQETKKADVEFACPYTQPSEIEYMPFFSLLDTKKGMCTTFRQWIGRLIRTEDDIGDLYILDSRYWEIKNHKTLEYWISKMAIIQDTQIDYEFTEESKILNNIEEVVKRVIIDFENEHYTDNIKQYLLDNIDYISKHKRLPLLTTNTMEFNKQVYKIKSLLEKLLAE